MNPHYVESGGDFFWKEPDEGQNIAKIVDVIGDGNTRPFKGQDANVLYVQFILATTMFSARADGQAKIKVNMPPGYECTVRRGEIIPIGSQYAAGV
jgi:hypothetical protein